MSLNNNIDDDASIVQRKVQIEEMRARVEARLESLLKGDSLSQLKQQVTDLRESTLAQSQTSLFNTTTATAQRHLEEEEEDVPWDPQEEIHFDPSVATTTTEQQDIQFDPTQPVFVQRAEIQDPYGDAGSYTGWILQNHNTQRPCGSGTMEYYDGRIYEGEWKDGRWHGTGKGKTTRIVVVIVVSIRNALLTQHSLAHSPICQWR